MDDSGHPGFANVIGVDDGPHRSGAPRPRGGDVLVLGTVYADARLDGVVTSKLRRDGRNSTRAIAEMIMGSRFHQHAQCVLLQGITFGGFNVVDIHALAETVERPVLVVARHAPDLERIRDVLLSHVPGGARKWALIERAGPMEPCEAVFVQRAGLSEAVARATVTRHTRHGGLPEPLRVAHLLGAAFVRGHSHGGA